MTALGETTLHSNLTHIYKALEENVELSKEGRKFPIASLIILVATQIFAGICALCGAFPLAFFISSLGAVLGGVMVGFSLQDYIDANNVDKAVLPELKSNIELLQTVTAPSPKGEGF